MLAVVACSAGPTDASSDAEVVGGSRGRPAPACIAGSDLRFPGYDEDLTVISSATATHAAAAYTFGSFLDPAPDKDAVSVVARGSGALEGNFQYVARSDFELCGGAVHVAKDARIELSGEGLTAEELKACAQDLSGAPCSVLAHYCEPESFEFPPGTGALCKIKAGVKIAASVLSPAAAACMSGESFAKPGFDEELETVTEARASHDPRGYVLMSDVPADAASLVALVSVLGQGDHQGNWQRLADDAWVVCGADLTVKPHASVQFSGEGLTQAELEACATNMSRPECSTLAHYCKDGTLKVSSSAPPRCELKAGARVEATFSRRSS